MVEWNWRCERVDLEVKKERKFFLFPTRRRLGLLFFFFLCGPFFSFSLSPSVFCSSISLFFSATLSFLPPLLPRCLSAFSKTERSNTSFSSEHGSRKKKCLILVLMSYRSILLLPLPSSLFLSLFFFVSFFLCFIKLLYTSLSTTTTTTYKLFHPMCNFLCFFLLHVRSPSPRLSETKLT